MFHLSYLTLDDHHFQSWQDTITSAARCTILQASACFGRQRIGSRPRDAKTKGAGAMVSTNRRSVTERPRGLFGSLMGTGCGFGGSLKNSKVCCWIPYLCGLQPEKSYW